MEHLHDFNFVGKRETARSCTINFIQVLPLSLYIQILRAVNDSVDVRWGHFLVNIANK